MLNRLVTILKSPQRGPFRAIKKSRRTVSVVLATCIVLTIFATFFQSEDILFFYDKLLITDESIQVPYDTILKNRNQLEAQKIWITQAEIDNSKHKYGFNELTWRKVNNKAGFEPNVNDALVYILNMAQPNMTHVEYIGFGCAVGKTLFILDHVLQDSMLTCVDSDPLTNAAKSYFKQQTRDTAEAAEWTSERGNKVHWHSAEHAVWSQHSLQYNDAFVLVHVRGYTTAKSLRTLAERVAAAELNGRKVFVVIEGVDPSDPTVAEALLEVWRASNIKGEFGALITGVLSSIESQPRKVFFVGAEPITDALLPAKLRKR